MERRDFVKHAALVAAGGLAGTPLEALAAGPPRGRSARGSAAPLPSADLRHLLLAEARFGRKRPASSRRGMVITSHPLATRAAADVLRRGGNACDAALCACITQTVVEPHMTTITGVLSMLHYDAASGNVSYLNGGMNAPKAALPGFTAAEHTG